jgi:hypothetical protein
MSRVGVRPGLLKEIQGHHCCRLLSCAGRKELWTKWLRPVLQASASNRSNVFSFIHKTAGRSLGTFWQNCIHFLVTCIGAWLIRRLLDCMIRFIILHTLTQFGTTGSYRPITVLRTFRSAVTQTLGFSVFTSRILATDLSQSHWHFNSHIKSSCHRVIPFLGPILRLPVLNAQVHFQPHIPTRWRLEARPFTSDSTALQLLLPCLYSSRAEQSSNLLRATSQHGHSWHRAPLGPMAIYLFNVKTFVFFLLSLFLLW